MTDIMTVIEIGDIVRYTGPTRTREYSTAEDPDGITSRWRTRRTSGQLYLVVAAADDQFLGDDDTSAADDTPADDIPAAAVSGSRSFRYGRLFTLLLYPSQNLFSDDHFMAESAHLELVHPAHYENNPPPPRPAPSPSQPLPALASPNDPRGNPH